MQRLYYGWVVLLTVSITELVSWGILYYAFSVFVGPMSAELGWTTLELSGAFSLTLLVAGICAIPVGRWLDQHGPRALMTGAACMAVLILWAWSQVTQLWAFYLIMAGIGVMQSALLYEPAFAIVATWFRLRRGQALTILTFFGALASPVFIPLTDYLIRSLGWRSALLALAVIQALVTIVPHAIFLRRRPQDLGLLPDGLAIDGSSSAGGMAEHSLTWKEALREPGFWRLSLAFGSSIFATVAMTVHSIPLLLERGHDSIFAARIAGMFGLMSLFGRLILGPLGERIPRWTVTSGLVFMQIGGLLILLLLHSEAGALTYIVLFGAGSGTMTIMRAALLAERYGPAHYGRISGILNMAQMLARTAAPLAAGLIATSAGGYVALLWVLMIVLGLGVVALWRV